MKYIDLFAGIGGFHLGMEQAGHECIGWVEWDKFARKSYQAIHDVKGVWNASDIRTVRSTEIPRADCWCFGFPCFVAGTLVATESGLKPIETVTDTDRVVTIDGSFQKVAQTMVKTSYDVYQVSVQGQLDTEVTGNHPYWVRKRDTVYKNRVKTIVYGGPEWLHVDQISAGDLVMSYQPQVPSTVSITDEEAWLLGRYVADGYISNGKRPSRGNSYNHKTIFAIGNPKVDTFKEHLTEYHATESTGTSVTKFIVSNEHLMDLAMDFGRGALNKEIPMWVYGLPESQQRLLIDGALSGDGDITSRGYTRYTTTSKTLAVSLQKLVEKTLHVGVSLFHTERPKTHVVEGRVVNQHDTYALQFSLNQKSTRVKELDGNLWYPVKGVTKLESSQDVYNLEVENNHTYTANGIVVHNCQDISVAGKQGGFTSGRRSSLFFTVAGLLRGIQKEDRPAYLLIENVKNLLSINGGWDFAKLQIELDEIGYDVEWDVLDSAEVVPQHRERIFIVGHLRGRRTRKVFPISRQGGETNKEIKEITKINKNRHSSEGNSVLETNGLGQTISATSFKHVMKIAINQVGNISNSKSYNGNPQVGRVYDSSGISPTLSTMQGGGQEPKIAIPVSDVTRINKDQNGRRIKTNGEPEFTLTGQDRHGVLTNDLRIRKLTPRECWRLQGFPDWAFNRAKNSGLSDSQLYKQAGNSVTVPVVRLIAERMALTNESRR